MDGRELRAQRDALIRRKQVLINERVTLAPAALNGAASGPQARDRRTVVKVEIAAIDDQLVDIEDALRSPEYLFADLAQRLDANFAKALPTLQHRLRVLVSEKVPQTARLLGVLIGEGRRRDAEHLIAGLPMLYRDLAAEVTGELYAVQEHREAVQFQHAVSVHDLTEAERPANKLPRLAAIAAIKRGHTDQLLASVELPPLPETAREFVAQHTIRNDLTAKVPADVKVPQREPDLLASIIPRAPYEIDPAERRPPSAREATRQR